MECTPRRWGILGGACIGSGLMSKLIIERSLRAVCVGVWVENLCYNRVSLSSEMKVW